jgi:hypothetical protein
MICKKCRAMVGRSNLTESSNCKDSLACNERLKNRDTLSSEEESSFNFRKIDPSSLRIPSQRKDNE